MSIIESIGNRLLYLRKKVLNISQEKLGERLSLTGASVSRYEKDIFEFNDRTISDICRIFNVNEEWLRHGTGEIFQSSEFFSLDEFVKIVDANELEVELIKTYLSLPKDLREKLMNHMETTFTKVIDKKREAEQEQYNLKMETFIHKNSKKFAASDGDTTRLEEAQRLFDESLEDESNE